MRDRAVLAKLLLEPSPYQPKWADDPGDPGIDRVDPGLKAEEDDLEHDTGEVGHATEGDVLQPDESSEKEGSWDEPDERRSVRVVGEEK